MSNTALVFVVVYVVGLALAFKNPIWGLTTYMWAFYDNPNSQWWNRQLPDLRWSLIAAAVTFIAFVIHSSRQEAPGTRAQPHGATSASAPPSLGPGFWLLALMAVWMWVQSAWAINLDTHLEGCMLFTKYLMLYFVIVRLIRTEAYLELLSWVHVAGCFLWGWILYTSNLSFRAELGLGPGVEDSNTLGFHLVTGLAFGGFMLLGLKDKRRLLLLGMLPFIMNGIILTSSRGAVVAMAAAGVSALIFAPRARRLTVWAGAALGIVLFLRLAGSDLFWQRMNTIQVTGDETEMEASAYSRFEIASANWQMFLDHPFGAGYRGNVALSPRYLDEKWLTEGRRAAHNTFLAVLVDMGAPGFLVLLTLLGWSLARLVALKRLDKKGLSTALGTYRGAIAAGLVAYIVAGQFGNFVTAEVSIWLLAMTAALDSLAAAAVLPLAVSSRSTGVSDSRAAVPALRGLGAYSQRSAHLLRTTSDQSRR